MIAVTLNDKGTVETVTRILGEAKQPRRILKAVERGMQNKLKSHFRDRHKKNPNKLGGKRQKFWLQVAAGVQPGQIDLGMGRITIPINHPAIAQKVKGGPIRAKRVQNLSIPVDKEAYGRNAATYERETGNKLFFIKSGRFALLVTKMDPDSKFFQAIYLLTPSVYQKPDPDALPSEAEMNAVIVESGNEALQRQINPNNGATNV